MVSISRDNQTHSGLAHSSRIARNWEPSHSGFTVSAIDPVVKLADSCCLCSGNSYELVAERLRDGSTDRQVYRCKSCSHLQLLPRPSPEENRRFYDENMQERAARSTIDPERDRQSFQYDTQRRVGLVSELVPAGSTLLDIGAGYGFFVDEMAKKGYAVKGLEISDERRALGKSVTDVPLLGVDITKKAEVLSLAPVDIVTMFHVLEHIGDPISFLTRVSQLIDRNGVLVCEVPNAEELLLEACPAYRGFYWIRAHLSYFTARTLRATLCKAGFTVSAMSNVQRYGVENLCNWLTTGSPQLDAPKFELHPPFGWLEEAYRERLQETGRSDTLVAIARNR